MLAHERCLSSRNSGTARPESVPDATSAKDAVTASSATGDIAREFQCLLQDGIRVCAIERDRWKSKLRHIFVLLIVTVLIVSIACAALMTSVAFVFFGTAQVLADALGGKVWLGYLLTGTFGILGAATFLLLAVSWWNRNAFRQTQLRYEGTVVCKANADSEREFLDAGASLARAQFRNRTTSVKDAVVKSALAHPIATAAIAGGAGVFLARTFVPQHETEIPQKDPAAAQSQQHLPIAPLIEILTKLLGV